jgi:chromosome segregation ATPase
MARLEMSKALLLLSSGLDAEQREELAGKAAEDGATVRELREESRKLKVKVVGETGATAEIKAQLKKAEAERAQLVEQMKAREDAWSARLEAETGKAYERGLKEQTDGTEQEIRKEFQGKLDYNQSQINALQLKLNDAESRRKTAERENSRQWDRGFEAGKRENEKMANELEKQIRGNVEISEGLKKKDEEIRALKAKLLTAENNRVEVVPADYEQLKRDRADLIEAAEEAEKRAQDAEARLEEARSQGGGNAGDAYRVLRCAVERFMAEADLLPTRAMELHGDKRVATQLAQLDAWLNWMRDELSKAGDRVDLEGAVSIR